MMGRQLSVGVMITMPLSGTLTKVKQFVHSANILLWSLALGSPKEGIIYLLVHGTEQWVYGKYIMRLEVEL